MKIWSMKQNAAAEEKKKPKVSAAQIRVQKDLTELSLPSTMKTTFPNPEDLLNFQLSIKPDEGMSTFKRGPPVLIGTQESVYIDASAK